MVAPTIGDSKEPGDSGRHAAAWSAPDYPPSTPSIRQLRPRLVTKPTVFVQIDRFPRQQVAANAALRAPKQKAKVRQLAGLECMIDRPRFRSARTVEHDRGGVMMRAGRQTDGQMIGEGSLAELKIVKETIWTVWEYIACPAKSKVLESQVFGNQVLENQAFGNHGLETRKMRSNADSKVPLRCAPNLKTIASIVPSATPIAWPEQECSCAAGQNGKWINSRMTVKIIRQLEASCVSAVSVPEPPNRR